MNDIFHLTLECARADEAGDPHAFRTGTQDYLLRSSGGSYTSVSLRWNDALLADLAALRQPRRDAVVVQRVGEVLRRFVAPSGWQRVAGEAAAAAAAGQTVVLTIRSAAAEIYALPWELVTLASGRHIGALDHVLVRYEWPETHTTPSTAGEGGRVVFGWSAAGGAIPAARHQGLITDACARGNHPFDLRTDVVPHLTIDALGALVSKPDVAVLHLLAHGAAAGESTYGLMLDAPDGSGPVVVDPGQLRRLLAPHADHLRLVVICACDSGNTGDPGNPLGSLAQALHRAGIAAVVASRFPLSVNGSNLLCEAFYDSLLGGPTAVETALLKARRRLLAESATLDWASIQLYARAADGHDTRPIVVRPYRGLLAYQPPDARFFFGRDAERTELLADLEALRDQNRPRFLVVAGASGTGKSSMVLAGAVPDLLGLEEAAHHRDETVEIERIVESLRRLLPTYDPPAVRQSLDLLVQLSPGVKSSVSGWRYFAFRPGARPIAALEATLGDLNLQQGPVLIIVDQFEELFTQCADAAAREAFAQRLWSLARLPDAQTHVIITIRVDYLGQCGDLVVDESGLRLDRVAYDEAHRVFVAQMTPAQMRAAIEEPANKVGLLLEAGLVDRMLADVEGEPGALPVLSYTLDLLWQNRDGRMLTQAAYDALGGVAGALHGRANALLDGLGFFEQQQARRLLVRLVAVEDGAWDARRRVRIDDMRPGPLWHVPAFESALAALVDARLLVQGQEGAHATVELAHEALIRRWERLRGWIVEDQEMLAQVNTVERWVGAWQDFGTLLQDDQLGYAAQVRDQFAAELSEDARVLIQESEDALDTRARRRRWTAIGFGVTLALIAVSMLGLGIWGLTQKSEAESNAAKSLKTAQSARAEEARATAATRVSVARGLEYRDPLLASLFLLEFAGRNGVDASLTPDDSTWLDFATRPPPAGGVSLARRLAFEVAPSRRLTRAKVIDGRFRAQAGVDPPRIVFARSGEVLTAVDGLVRVHRSDGSRRLGCGGGDDYRVTKSAFARDGQRVNRQTALGLPVALWEERARGNRTEQRLCALSTEGLGYALPVSRGLGRPARLVVSADGQMITAIWEALPCAIADLAMRRADSIGDTIDFAQAVLDDLGADNGEICGLVGRWMTATPNRSAEWVRFIRPIASTDLSADGRTAALTFVDAPGQQLDLTSFRVSTLESLAQPLRLRFAHDDQRIIGRTATSTFLWDPQESDLPERLPVSENERVAEVQVRGPTTSFLVQHARTELVVLHDGATHRHAARNVSDAVLVDGRNPRVGLLRPGVHWQFRDVHTPLIQPGSADEDVEALVSNASPDLPDLAVLPDWADDADSLQRDGIVGRVDEREAIITRPTRASAERATVTIERACVSNVERTVLGPRGRTLLVITPDTACLLPTTADGRVQQLAVDGVVDAAFRSDGRFVALLEEDGAAAIWPVNAAAPRRLSTGQNIVRAWFPPLEGTAAPVLYGIDTRSTLHRWRMQIGTLTEHLPAIEDVVGVTPDGLWAVVDDAAGARLLSLTDADPLPLVDFEPGRPLQFSADSRLIAQIHRRGGVWIWTAPNAASHHLPGSERVDRVRIGAGLVAGLSADRLHVWRVGTDGVQRLGTLPVEADSRVRITPDGRSLLLDSKAAGRPSLTRISVNDLQARYHFKVPDGVQTLGAPRISPDGRFVVADAAVDNRVDRLFAWPINSTDGEPRVLRGQNALDGYQINGWSFAARPLGGSDGPGGKADRVHVLIRSNVGAIERRALGDDGIDGSLLGHSRVVEDLVYHPSGRLITRGQNDEVRLWLARNRTGATGFLSGQFTTQVLDDGTAQIENAVFGPKGEWLVTQTRYGRLWAWPLAWPTLMRLLRDRTDACLTADERVRFLGGKWNHAQAEAAACVPSQLR